MDVNGTKFHSLLGKSDWTSYEKSDWTSYDTELSSELLWDEQDNCVRLRSRLIQDKDQRKQQLMPSGRRGAASDHYGNIYWIGDDETEIRFISREGGPSLCYWSLDNWYQDSECEESSGHFKTVKPVEPNKPSRLRGLTITLNAYLVVGIMEPAGLLVFDLHAGNPPQIMLWPEEIPFEPFDMTNASDGGLWILDKSEQPKFWRLDENFRVLSLGAEYIDIAYKEQSVFQPKDSSDECRKSLCFPLGIEMGLSSPVIAVDPISIEALPDDTVIILGFDKSHDQFVLYHYRRSRLLGEYSFSEHFKYLEKDPETENYKLIPQDLVFVRSADITTDDLSGSLFVSAADRKQTFIFNLKMTIEGLELGLHDCYYPMRTTQGKALVVANGKVFYDAQDNWIPLIAQRSHYWNQGHVTTRVFDGRKHDCVWHRLFLDAVIPDGAEVIIDCWAANEQKLFPDQTTLKIVTWKRQPQPYLRTLGSELPFHKPYHTSVALSQGTDTWETLLHGAKGRYLKIRLTFKGTGRNTPRIRSLRVYYPRFSYLQEYLPAVYRDDVESADFLERFLANVEGLYTTIEDRIAGSQLLFDVDSVPAEYLDWLAGWLGIIRQASWGEGRFRLWLTHAMELFFQRGTVPGIIRAVRLATDPCPDDSIFTEDVTAYYHPNYSTKNNTFSGFHVRIVENFLQRQAPGLLFGDPTDMNGQVLYTETEKWTLFDGAKALHKNYQEYLKKYYDNAISTLNNQWDSQFEAFSEIKFPPLQPSNDNEATDWYNFLQNELNFTYQPVTPRKEDIIAYQDFLARRYRIIKNLNVKWSLPTELEYTSFSKIPLPSKLPANEQQLFDWVQFVSIALPTKRNAHRFTVLVPTALNNSTHWTGPDPEVVRQVVELEKPAHTEFEVKQYFAMFRVGEARLGMETIIEPGRQLKDVVLGDNYLAEGFLSLPPEWKAPERFILGRDFI